jgi:hypothetical protein
LDKIEESLKVIGELCSYMYEKVYGVSHIQDFLEEKFGIKNIYYDKKKGKYTMVKDEK